MESIFLMPRNMFPNFFFWKKTCTFCSSVVIWNKAKNKTEHTWKPKNLFFHLAGQEKFFFNITFAVNPPSVVYTIIAQRSQKALEVQLLLARGRKFHQCGDLLQRHSVLQLI